MTEGWIPDPPFRHSRERGNPGSFACTNETRKTGRAHRHPDSVGDDLQPALSGAEGCRPVPVLPVLSEAEGSGAEGCRPAFPNNEGKNKDTGCPIKPGMTAGWIPDPSFRHSCARGNPGSLFSRGIRQEGRAHRPAPTRRHPDPVGDDLQPALSGAEGCRPASFQTTEPPKHWMPDPSFCHSRARGNPGSFACTNETPGKDKVTTLDARSSRA